MQKDEGRRPFSGNPRGIHLRPAPTREVGRCTSPECPMGCARAIHHGDRHPARDGRPPIPAMKAAEIIRAHDPHEMHAAATAHEGVDEVSRVDKVPTPLPQFVTSMHGWSATRHAARSRSPLAGSPRTSFSGFPGDTSHQMRSSCRRRMARRLASRCPSCGGSNDPPNSPIRRPRLRLGGRPA